MYSDLEEGMEAAEKSVISEMKSLLYGSPHASRRIAGIAWYACAASRQCYMRITAYHRRRLPP
jgi:hypothetical protein